MILSAKEIRAVIRMNSDNWRKMHGKPMKRHRTWVRALVQRVRRKARREFERERKINV